jgi:site-specific DNA recombinase
MKPLPTPKVDAIVWTWMKEVLLNPDEVEAELREQSAHVAEKHAALDKELQDLYGRKVEIENQLRRLLGLYARGTFPEEMLDTEVAQQNRILSSIETEIARVDRQRQTPLTEDRITALRAFAEELQRGIEVAEQDFDARRRLVELMDVRVTVVWRDQEIWFQITSDLGEGLLRYTSKSL